MGSIRRIVITLVALATLSPMASAYYYWVYFANRNVPFNPAPAKFDLNALPDYHTVSYFISEQGPASLITGDTYQALVSQIRLAAEVWNGVATSDLRVKFGGISSAQTLDGSPGIDVVFDDNMPPGLVAQSKPMTVDNVSFVANGAAFVPILRARLQFRKDFTKPYRLTSFYDSFFLTMVHEFGHTLGLQHTLTSSVMSTSATRATTKAKPISADDVAGISLLYPAQGFLANTGSITGKVLLSGNGVNMASVVALSATGAAVSNLTNPDGTYRIDGVPPGQYYVYVHPLPPAQQGEGSPGDISPAQDSTGRQFPANIGFGSQFYGGTTDWTQTPPINVTAGSSADNVSFNVQRRSGPAVYGMQAYAGLGPGGQVVVPAPPLQSGSRLYLVFDGTGAVVNNQIAPGLNISVIGGSAQLEPDTLQYYQGYAIEVVSTYPVSSDTPTALAVTVNGDLYVLPAAFTVVPTGPPSITSVIANAGNPRNVTAIIAGANLGPTTRILFDGARANVLAVTADGSLLVAPPPASGSYRATVEALSGDVQTSSQTLGSASPPIFTYNAADYPALAVKPASITAGTDALIEVTGYNTNFTDGQTVAGFGSADIVVRHTWVVSPGRLLINASVGAGAAATLTSVTVASGLQLAVLSTAFQIAAPNPGQMSLRAPVLNQATNLEGVPMGGTALINTTGLPLNLTGWILTIANQNTPFVSSRGQIAALVPGGLVVGPQVVRLVSPNGDNIAPILMQVDPPPPTIVAVSNAASLTIDGLHQVHPGDVVSLTVAGLSDDTNAAPPAAGVHIIVGGVDHVASSVTSLPGQLGACLVQFVLASNVPIGPQQPVTVNLNTRVSAQYFLNISRP